MHEKKPVPDLSSTKKCSCCPYGFHIDRDFVRYCDSLYNSAQLDKLRQHRRERRKEKKSVESYLGLANLGFVDDSTPRTMRWKTNTLPQDLQDNGLKDAVSDFEDTWRKSLKRSCSGSDIPTRKNGFKSLHIGTYSNPTIDPDEIKKNGFKSLHIETYSNPTIDPDEIISPLQDIYTSAEYAASSHSAGISNFHTAKAFQGLLSPVECNNIPSKKSSSFSYPAGINKNALTHIREQMAASLKRMRELEEQVKTIPVLEVKLYALNEEKQSLLEQLKIRQQNITSELTTEKSSFREKSDRKATSPESSISYRSSKSKQHDLSSPGIAFCLDTAMSSKLHINAKLPETFSSTPKDKEVQKHSKNIGISCCVLTREIGIGYVPSKFRSIGVGSDVSFKDIISSFKSKKSLEQFTSMSSESVDSDSESLHGSDEHSRFFQRRLSKSPPHDFSIAGLAKSRKHSSTNTDTKYCYDKSANTDPVEKPPEIRKLSKSVVAVPVMSHKATQIYDSKVVRSMGCQTSELKVEKTVANKVPDQKLTLKRDAAVGEFSVSDALCSSCKKTKKSIGVGDSSINTPVCSQCGSTESSPKAKSPTFKRFVTNCENCILRQTETIGVGDLDVNLPICQNCDVMKPENSQKIQKQSVGTTTSGDFSSSLSVASGDIHICDKCSATIQSVAQGFAGKNVESKIPRPTTLKLTGVTRSATTSRSNSFKRSQLQAQVIKNQFSMKDTTVSVKEKDQKTITVRRFEAENLASKLNNDFKKSAQETTEVKSPDILPDFESLPAIPHKKAILSKELKAACKVLNDHLQKPERGGEKRTTTSQSIIQKEWFKIANQKNADPLLIEDYLDAFEEFSKILLHKIVNLSDNNGNTALHYAVSYGNFDVVSILIDSKVCDVNKKNKAGYTSIMLVALANMKNDAHNYVVQRLFSIGEINEKAAQNGQTALMLAVSHGKREVVRLLLESGAEVNLRDRDGSTALMCAAENGQLDIVRGLLAHPECDPTLVDNDDCNALAIAMDAGHKDIGLLIYANMNFSRGSSPYSTLKKKRSTPRSTPPLRTPTARTPPLPSPSARSTNSIPSSFQFPS